MCFSASASFGAGAVLSVIGVVSIKMVRQPSHSMFAAIPLIFCVQQISEGFLWLSLAKPAYAFMQQPATYIFLFFAQVLWPVYVPLSILVTEKKERSRQIHKILTLTGAMVSLYLAFCLLSYHVEAKIIGYHISYVLDYPAAFSNLAGGLYIIATIAPPFFSTIKGMWHLGATILVSYIITNIFYTDYIVSVWCFFASVISIIVVAIVHEMAKLNKPG
jgi:hypothetical protein